MGDFIVVCEVGLGNFTVERYPSDADARAAASQFWCCWCLFHSTNSGTELKELASGGVGFSAGNIRKYAERI